MNFTLPCNNRDGYDFDARYDDGLASRKDKDIFDTVLEHGALLSVVLI